MIAPRRVTLQLTSLLDLLLIVFFAQYLEQRIQGEQASQKARHQAQQEARAEHQTATLQITQLMQELSRVQQLLESQKDQLKVQSATLERHHEEVEAARTQRDLIGKLASEIFKVPDEALSALRTQQASPFSDADLQRLKNTLKTLQSGDGAEMVRHLLTFDELRKRTDLWDLHIHENGVIDFTSGDQGYEFRADSTERFAKRLFEIYKTLPQPKSMVIILVSYGDARLRDRQVALEGLPAAIEKMRLDSNSRTRFDYANLGFRSQGK